MANGKSKGEARDTDTDRDRYPSSAEGLRRVLSEGNLPDGPIERLEVRFTAGGEATYRWWAPRAEEAQGGYLGPQ